VACYGQPARNGGTRRSSTDDNAFHSVDSHNLTFIMKLMEIQGAQKSFR
jgi:hypothetical protein